MVEVFRTNVTHQFHTEILVQLIKRNFKEHEVSFDLEDCDKILRIENKAGAVEILYVLNLLESLGFKAEILSDEDPEMTYDQLNILTVG